MGVGEEATPGAGPGKVSGHWPVTGKGRTEGSGCVQGDVLLRRWEFQGRRQLKRGSEMAASLYCLIIPMEDGDGLETTWKFSVHPLPAPHVAACT